MPILSSIVLTRNRKEFTPLDSHIYTSKRINSIRILCTQENINAEKEPKYAGGWHINGVHQYSLGGGHSATCDRCLIIYARKVLRHNDNLFTKIINLADRNINNLNT